MTKEGFIATLLVAVSVLSAGVALWKFGLMRDYIVYANVPCDPALDSCFVGDGENTPELYKSIEKPAYAVPHCNGWADECPILSCRAFEDGCYETLCDPAEEEGCYGPLYRSD